MSKQPGRPTKVVEEIKEDTVETTEAVTSTKNETPQNDMLAFMREQSEIMANLRDELASLKASTSEPKKVVEKQEEILNIENIKAKTFSTNFDKLSSLNLPEKVSIKHYINQSNENMGLRDMGLAVLDGEGGQGGFKESFGYITKAGVKYFLTGFEEHCHNVTEIKNIDERRAYLKELNNVKEILEEILGVDMSSRNIDFWKEQHLTVRSPLFTLDLTNPADLILYFGILGGAISSVAASKEHAENSNRGYKHYLHVQQIEQKQKIGKRRTKNKAIAKLEELYENQSSGKLFSIAKTILPISKGYTNKDGIDLLYSDIFDFIEGINVQKNPLKGPQIFLDAVVQTQEDLTIRAVINEAMYTNIIRENEDKFFYNTDTMTTLGTDKGQVFSFLKNPVNSTELEGLYERVSNIWGA